MLETAWESRWLPDKNKSGLVLPVIRGFTEREVHKRLRFLMTDETGSQKDSAKRKRLYLENFIQKEIN